MRRTSFGLIVALSVAGCSGPAAGTLRQESASPEAVAAASPALVPVAPSPTVQPTARPTVPPTPPPAPLCPAVDESAVDANQIVLATANIFGAGRKYPPAPGHGGAGIVPPVWPLAAGTSSVAIRCAMGSVIPIRSDNRPNGPDGDHIGRTDVKSYQGISGIIHDTNGMFLTGVFLGDAEPVDPAPDRLDFSTNEAFATLSPALGQTFFVGDGAGRTFTVPAGATRLFLGFADASQYQGDPGWYGNNTGYLDVTVELSQD